MPAVFDIKGELKTAETKMVHAIEALDKHLQTIRTGRASASLLDRIRVEVYGQSSAISAVASVTTPDARNILITPWDKSQLSPIEKAIQTSDIGINPINDGKSLRLTLPPLTEERRKDLTKKAHGLAEDSRVAIRNVRKHSKEAFEKAKKGKQITEDETRDAETNLQKLTDKHIAKVDEVLKKKEKEIMEI